jgi:hypothetical protein
MQNDSNPLAQFGTDPVDLRWTLRDIAGKRTLMINQAHLAPLIDLGLVAMREGNPYLTVAGQNAAWGDDAGLKLEMS